MRFQFLSDLEKSIANELLNPPAGIELKEWPSFHRLTGGLRMGELTLLTSGTGTGKTTFLANLATQTCIMGISSYVASVEVGAVPFLLSMLSVLSGRDFNTGERFTEQDVKDVHEKYLPLLRAARVAFARHDDRVDPKQIAEEIIEAHTKYGVKFAILDNLQFFSRLVEAQNERIEQDRVIREFVKVVKSHPIHVFLIVHSRKTNNDNQRVESLADLKGSKTLADEAWNVFALNKPRTSDIEKGICDTTDRELLILKLRRRGKNVGQAIQLAFLNGGYLEIVNHEAKSYS